MDYDLRLANWMERLLIIDDDVDLCELLVERLSQDGFALDTAHDGITGLERGHSGEYALIILDLMLPGIGGLDVLRRLRTELDVPVLILTARGEDVERILGLEIGADDYLPKPFNPRELIARIRAILRRAVRGPQRATRLTVGDISLDPASREVWLQDKQLELTSLEFTLLETFLRGAGRVLTRTYLTETVLARTLGPFDRVIDVHVSNLRKKLGRSPAGERIKAVRNAGYLFVARSETKRK
jgi:DNA-binding response OmpR family regulator